MTRPRRDFLRQLSGCDFSDMIQAALLSGFGVRRGAFPRHGLRLNPNSELSNARVSSVLFV